MGAYVERPGLRSDWLTVLRYLRETSETPSVLRPYGGGWGGSNASACSSEAICYLNVIFIGSFRVERAERMANDKLDPPSLR